MTAFSCLKCHCYAVSSIKELHCSVLCCHAVRLMFVLMCVTLPLYWKKCHQTAWNSGNSWLSCRSLVKITQVLHFSFWFFRSIFNITSNEWSMVDGLWWSQPWRIHFTMSNALHACFRHLHAELDWQYSVLQVFASASMIKIKLDMKVAIFFQLTEFKTL